MFKPIDKFPEFNEYNDDLKYIQTLANQKLRSPGYLIVAVVFCMYMIDELSIKSGYGV